MADFSGDLPADWRVVRLPGSRKRGGSGWAVSDSVSGLDSSQASRAHFDVRGGVRGG